MADGANDLRDLSGICRGHFRQVATSTQQRPNASCGEGLSLAQNDQAVAIADIHLVALPEPGLFPKCLRDDQLALAGNGCLHDWVSQGLLWQDSSSE